MFVDLLRALHGQLFGLAIFLVIVIIGGVVARKKVSSNPQTRNYVNWAIIALISIALLIVAIRAVHMVSVNETPRSVIDRSDVNQDAETFQKNVGESTKEGAKK